MALASIREDYQMAHLDILPGADEARLTFLAVRRWFGWSSVHRRSAARRRGTELRRHVRAEIAREVGAVMHFGQPDHAVATSKTFRQLARIAGAAPSGEGEYVRRVLTHSDATR
ncbi:MAG: hypothetical protein ACRDOO_17210 [Actinomadura sp.]